ncbi:MAG: TetR/AcrR family transcriptional regulator [Hymenobacter sp.]|nr:MAG: TetR/AcrR family transcriptional regulator [Hymenobacter sp.]
MKKNMDKRERILEATLQLVQQEGFYHLNMKKVSVASEVAAGTIYLYFKGKEEIITELYRYVMQLYMTAVLAGQQTETDPVLKIKRMLREYLQFFMGRPDCFSFAQQYLLSPFRFKDTAMQVTILAPLLDFITQAQAQGIVKDLPMEMLLALAIEPLNGMLNAWRGGTGITDLHRPERQQQLLAACWASIAGPAAAGS